MKKMCTNCACHECAKSCHSCSSSPWNSFRPRHCVFPVRECPDAVPAKPEPEPEPEPGPVGFNLDIWVDGALREVAIPQYSIDELLQELKKAAADAATPTTA